MIVCPKCESLMPTHYKKCQKCGCKLPKANKDNTVKFIEPDNDKQKEVKENLLSEAMAVNGEIDASEVS